jgi:hypothetical protein
MTLHTSDTKTFSDAIRAASDYLSINPVFVFSAFAPFIVFRRIIEFSFAIVSTFQYLSQTKTHAK